MPAPSSDFRPPVFHPRRPGLFRPVAVDPAGVTGPTKAQAGGRHWRRTSRGLHLPAWVDDAVPEQRIAEVAAALPPGTAVTGWAALRWLAGPQRGRWLDGGSGGRRALPISVIARGHRIRPPSGVVLSQERYAPDEVRSVDGVPLTSPWRSAAYEARKATGLLEAVRWLDLAAATDLVSVDELRAHAQQMDGWAGVRLLRGALDLADENTWSPMETELRLLWRLDLGLTDVVTNRPVFGLDGRFIGTPDLLDVELGVVGEYDGLDHLDRRRRARDVTREGDFRRVGLEYVTMTAADRRDPGDFLRRTTEARHRARLLAGTRRWTVEPPAGWVDTTTVAARRALSPAQRERLLRRGRAA